MAATVGHSLTQDTEIINNLFFQKKKLDILLNKTIHYKECEPAFGSGVSVESLKWIHTQVYQTVHD